MKRENVKNYVDKNSVVEAIRYNGTPESWEEMLDFIYPINSDDIKQVCVGDWILKYRNSNKCQVMTNDAFIYCYELHEKYYSLDVDIPSMSRLVLVGVISLMLGAFIGVLSILL